MTQPGVSNSHARQGTSSHHSHTNTIFTRIGYRLCSTEPLRKQSVPNHNKVQNTQDHQRHTNNRWAKQVQALSLPITLQHTHQQYIGASANQGAGAAQNRRITQGNQ